MTKQEFTTLIHKERTDLKQYARSLTRDSNDSKDLVQDTILKALKYKDRFRSGTNIRAWLFTIMRNTFINEYRRMLRQNSFYDYDSSESYIESKAPYTVNTGEQNMVLVDIEKAIMSINPNLSRPFTMNFKGYKYHEIADLLEIPIGTVKTRIFMARKELRLLLWNYGIQYGLEHS